ncbi:redoxin domain-containing protein [Fulvivirgaceae bacterium LMO-SS25]
MYKLIISIAVPVLLVILFGQFGEGLGLNMMQGAPKPQQADEATLEKGLRNVLPPIDTAKNQAIVINRWATWCGPCLEEIPDLNRLVETYGDRATFIAASDESKEHVANWISGKENFEFKYKLISGDSQLIELLNTLDTKTKGSAIPVHYLVNSDYEVEKVLLGAMESNIDEIETFLKKKLDNVDRVKIDLM